MAPVIEVAADVFQARGTDVNWYLLRDGRDVTLVDTGWAGDRPDVLASVRAIGARPTDVVAILITHAHIDHLGAVNHFHTEFGTPAYLDDVEVAHARREYLEQAGPGAVVRNLGRRGVAGWALRITLAGGLRDITVAHARKLPELADDGALDLPGRPVPVATHGHTSGHSAFHLSAARAVITGDGLVTGHPTTGIEGPHTLGGLFDHSPSEAVAALDALHALDADLVLPGHGPAHYGPVADAVDIARGRANAIRRA